MSDRRRFLTKGGGALAVIAAAGGAQAPAVIAQPKIRWRMPTSFPAALDIQFGAAQRLAKAVDEMSGGRLQIDVSQAGQIMQAVDLFDAASQGKVESYSGGSLFWGAKDPAFQWFTTVPFGMNPEGMMAWFHQGDGLKLFEETYAPFNLVPRPGAPTAPEMGGWYRKKITTTADYKGLKMRIPGLGGKVVARAGRRW